MKYFTFPMKISSSHRTLAIVAVHCCIFVCSFLSMRSLVFPLDDSEFFQTTTTTRQVSSTNISLDSSPKPDFAMELLKPVAAFEEWKKYHSAEAVRRNPHNRKYILSSYSCPRQAGNILLDFVSGLVQAVVTNRTFLYIYQTNPYWSSRDENSEEQCAEILTLASWVPSLRALRNELNLSVPVRGHVIRDWELSNFRPILVNGTLPGSIHNSAHDIVSSGQIWGIAEHFDIWIGLIKLSDRYVARYLSHAYREEYDPEVASLMSAEGTAFMYGMMFTDLFQFTPEMIDSVRPQLVEYDPDVFSVALHSRHPTISDTGADVQREIKCLTAAMNVSESRKQRCVFYIASDRVATIENLKLFSEKTSCEMVIASQAKVGLDDGKTAEHGPFAGAGYFRDLLVATQAEDVVIGDTRSSTALFAILVEYKRRIRVHPEWSGRAQFGRNAFIHFTSCSAANKLQKASLSSPKPFPEPQTE